MINGYWLMKFVEKNLGNSKNTFTMFSTCLIKIVVKAKKINKNSKSK